MTKFKLYFWSGFGKPELVATSLTSLMKDVHISDNYLGDATTDISALVRAYKDNQKNTTWDDFVEELESYNLYMDPDYSKFVDVSRQWFDITPSHLLNEFN